MDTVVPSVAEPRLCPECKRWITEWKGQYLCKDCWILYEFKETLPHPHPEGLCCFARSEAEVGVHFNCFKCSKSFFVLNERVEEHARERDFLFSAENVRARRLEKEDSDRQIHEEVESLKERNSKTFREWLKDNGHI